MPSRTTCDYESSLPKLPIPSLKSTLNQLRESLSPLISGDLGIEELEQKIDSFSNSASSEILQEHLLRLYREDDCYLNQVNSNHILVEDKALPRNPFLILENDNQSHQNQSERAANLTISALKFAASLRLGCLSQDVDKFHSLQTMKPYFNLFGTSRIPERNRVVGIKTFNESNHILILSNSTFYTLKVIDEENDLYFTVDELSTIFNQIVQESDKISKSNHTALGPITSDTYSNWAHAKRYLQREYPINTSKIDCALFVVVLDHSTPTDSDLAKTMSVGSQEIDEYGIQRGSCISRWYDKLQIVVTKNCASAVIWDSLSCDGTTVLRFTSDIYTDSILRLTQQFSMFPDVKTSKISNKPLLDKIEWDLNPEFETVLHLTETRLTDLICKHSSNTKTLKYGWRFSKEIGVKSDSMIQIGLQIAHYALYGKLISTLEPVSTRGFRNSRSEFIAIQTDLMLRCCQIFVSDLNSTERWQLFYESCQFHETLIQNSKRGEGFERHLKALQSIYLQKDVLNRCSDKKIPDEVPSLLFDEILSPLFKPEMIASNCGNPAMKLFGLTPAVSNGFGIGYIIKEDETDFCLISQYRQGDRLLWTLDWVLNQLKIVWKQSHAGVHKLSHAHELDNKLKQDDILGSKAMGRGYGEEDDVDIALGGYGYFDIEDIRLRSRTVSALATPSGSQRNSVLDLDKFVGRKLVYGQLVDDFGTNQEVIEEDLARRFDAKFDRGEVGTKVDVEDFLRS